MARKGQPAFVPAKVARTLWTKITPIQWLGLLHELAPDGGFREHGPHLKGRCVDPHHDDGKPSLYVTPSKGLAHCYSCTGRGTWSDPIEFVKTAKHVSYVDAAKFLRTRFKLREFIPDEQIARLDKEDAAADQRTLAAKVMCEVLHDAIEHRGEDVWDWSAPTIAWLEARRFGGDVATAPWFRLTGDQLIGVVPPRGHVANRYGENSPELRACNTVLGEYWMGHTYLGWLVFPWHALDRRVRRIKLRSPVVGAKDFVTVEAKDASDLWPGAYGIRAAMLRGEQAATIVLVAEGEPDALQLLASQDVGLGIDILAFGGSSAPSLDPLAILGVERALVIQDRDAGGIKFVAGLADETSAIALRPFAWPEAWAAAGVKDLDEAIRVLGFTAAGREVTTLAGIARNFGGLASWCRARAVHEAQSVAEDDHKAHGLIAFRWGEKVKDPHERSSYVVEVAEQLGLDAGTLARELGEARGVMNVEDFAPLTVARAWRDTMSPVVRYAGMTWRWDQDAGSYARVEDELIEKEAWTFLARCCVPLDTGADFLGPRLRGAFVADVVRALGVLASYVPSLTPLPAPLCGFSGPPDLRDKIIVRNGLLDLVTGELRPQDPLLFATAAAVAYDDKAMCPGWEVFLAQIFAGDAESIRLTRQIMGWIVSGDTRRHAIAWIIGEPRSGKGTIAKILSKLVNEQNVASTDLDTLATSRFETARLVGKTMALLPDERLSGRTDQARLAQVLLKLSGGDLMSAEGKGRDGVTVRPTARLVIMTNVPPMIDDAAGALMSRYRVVKTAASFAQREDLELEDKLTAELPGILRWAIEGYRDLCAHGWITPAQSADVVDDLERSASPVKVFAEERLELDSAAETSLTALYGAWCAWCKDDGRERPSTRQALSVRLRQAFPGKVTKLPVRKVMDGIKDTYLRGIKVAEGARAEAKVKGIETDDDTPAIGTDAAGNVELVV